MGLKANITCLILLFCGTFFGLLYLTSEKYPEDEPTTMIVSETEVAPEDVEYKMDNFTILLKDMTLKYHVRHEDINCTDKDLLIIVYSKPDHFTQRMEIRNTWVTDLTPNVMYKFIIGYTPEDDVRQRTRLESHQYNDVIFSDLVDTYRNLTLKVYASYQWQQHYCSDVHWFLKIDDDVFFNFDRLQYWIKKDFEKTSKLYSNMVAFGCTNVGERVNRNPSNKWYTSYCAYRPSYYPTYCNGPAYLLPTDAIQSILEHAPSFRYVSVEDAFFTGVIAEAAGVTRIDRCSIFSIESVMSSSDHDCDAHGVPYISTFYDHHPNMAVTAAEQKKSLNVYAWEMLKQINC